MVNPTETSPSVPAASSPSGFRRTRLPTIYENETTGSLNAMEGPSRDVNRIKQLAVSFTTRVLYVNVLAQLKTVLLKRGTAERLEAYTVGPDSSHREENFPKATIVKKRV